MPLIRRAKPIDIVEARRLYEQTNLPVDHIAAMHGIGRTALYQRIHLWGWRMRKPAIPLADPPRAPDENEATTQDPSSSDVAALAARIRRAVESELDAVEKVIAQLTPESGCEEAERAARVLASLARTLQEVTRLGIRSGAETPAKETDDERGPANHDDFIRELVRRMDAFAGRETAGVPADASGAAA